MFTLRISGKGLSFEREIPESQSLRILEMGMGDEIEEGDVTVSLKNEYLSFERGVSGSVSTRMMELAVAGDDNSEEENAEDVDEATLAEEIEEIENLVDEVK